MPAYAMSLKNFFILSLTLHLGVVMFLNFQKKQEEVQTLTTFELSLGTPQKLGTPGVPKKVLKKQVVASGPALKTRPQLKSEVLEEAVDITSAQTELVGNGGSPNGVAGASGNGGSPDGVDSPRARYNTELTKIINQHKHYPRMAKVLHQEGRVMVKVTLDKNGNVIDVEILQSSSYESLSKAAIDTIRKIKRFPPIPTEIGKEILSFNVPLDYKIAF